MIGLVLVCGFRIAMNVTDSGVIDVGYASVVGADRITHKQELYVDNDVHGDTYGPINYLAYVPFEQAFPWSGRWDGLPAAHAAAIFFDLMTILGLFVLGLRLRPGRGGRRLGLGLAWAWATYPFTFMVLMCNSNDALIGALLVWTLVALTSPARARQPARARHRGEVRARSARATVRRRRGRPAAALGARVRRGVPRRVPGLGPPLLPQGRIPRALEHDAGLPAAPPVAVLDLGPVRPRRACTSSSRRARSRWPARCSSGRAAATRSRSPRWAPRC